ncbi:MAG TPA: hypothetical protein VNB94_13715 [Mycobacteriales bacterium]|nr:hypothetical protein [Mycobacteriales bacterium]
MTDPMQLLEMPLDVVEPSPAFAHELRARLLADLGASRRRRWMRAGIAGAVAAAAAIAGLIALPGDGAGDAGLVVVAVTPSPQTGDGSLPSLGPVATPAAAPRVSPSASVTFQSTAAGGFARGRDTAPARVGVGPPTTPEVRLVPLSYGDVPHDGYAPYTVSDGNPREELSDPSVDLLAVDFVPLAERHFRVTLTLGAAPKAATQYIAESDLTDGCYVYWMMTPDTLAEWILFCDAQPADRTQASGRQGRVTVDGATITAEFDLSDPDSTPEVIYDAPVLGHSFSRACPDTGSCTNELTYDEARAPRDAEFRWR